MEANYEVQLRDEYHEIQIISLEDVVSINVDYENKFVTFFDSLEEGSMPLLMVNQGDVLLIKRVIE